MRYGAPVFDAYKNADEWASNHKKYGYNSAYSPINTIAELDRKDEYVSACKKHDIIIAEIGAWSNPMSADKNEAAAAFKNCADKLFIADQIGAKCCVNISGNAAGGRWDTHSTDNLTSETFDRIVKVTQDIIDSVKPVNTYYTLEMMPWMYPYDADTYLELIKAVNREHFAVHIDLVNVVNSPIIYYRTPELIKTAFKKLGKYIRSIHIKDIKMAEDMTVHLSEVMPGKGNFDLKCLVDEVKKLNPDIPMMLEHLATKEDYIEAGNYFTKLF